MKIAQIGMVGGGNRSTIKSVSVSEAVATEVRVELARRDITQQALAEALGVTPIWLSRRLRGHVPFALDEVAAIAQLLGRKVRDLLPEDDSDFGDNVAAFRKRKEAPTLGSRPSKYTARDSNPQPAD